MAPVPEKNRDAPHQGDSEGNDIGAMDMPQVTINAGSSSDSDDDSPEVLGYQLLPQEPEAADVEESMECDEEIVGDAQTGQETLDQTILASLNMDDHVGSASRFSVPESSLSDGPERRELWNNPQEKTEAEPMDPDHADKIKAAMANFTLPVSCQPAWARVIPEDDWKAKLFQRLHTKTETYDTGGSSTDQETRDKNPSKGKEPKR